MLPSRASSLRKRPPASRAGAGRPDHPPGHRRQPRPAPDRGDGRRDPGAARTEAEREALALSDALIAEVKEADLIVLGAPMYNFGMASTLKSWFDHVLRAGVTFRYGEAGPEGLVTGKKALVIETRAGFYSEGPAAAMDHQEQHIRTLLGFMGVTDVDFIRAEKLAFGPEAAETAIADAVGEIEGFAEQDWALAA
jgi:FMN-dependent NADH-azoreductase